MSEMARQAARKNEAKIENSIFRQQETCSSHSSKSSADQILFLQRTAGNQAVQRLIKSGMLQAKLKISQPNDIYEQEADMVAEQVMRMPEPKMQRQPLQITPLVQRQIAEKDTLQAKETIDQSTTVTPSIESQISELQGGGQSLDPATRAFFEPRFGHDFSGVRVHTDEKAVEAANVVDARAFTVGSHVIFASGQYSPNSSAGRRLLAHELTHTVQQLSTQGIEQVQRAPWGKCPKRKTVDPRGFIKKDGYKEKLKGIAGSLKIYTIAEQAAVDYYKQHPLAGRCVMTNIDLATDNVPYKCKGRDLDDVGVLIRGFHRDNKTKKRSMQNDPQITERVESLGDAVAELSAVAAILQPEIIDVTNREVYDVTSTPMAGEKANKVSITYVSLLNDLTEGDPWKAGQRPLQPGPGGGIITQNDYTICYLNTDFQKYPGVIQYVAYEKDDEEEEKKKKAVEQRLPIIIDLAPEISSEQSRLNLELRRAVGPMPVGTEFMIIAPPFFFEKMIMESWEQRAFEPFKFRGLEPRRNPVIGFHHLGMTLIGISAALMAIILYGSLALGEVGALAAGSVAIAETGTATDGTVISLVAYKAAQEAAKKGLQEAAKKAAGVLIVIATFDATRAEANVSNVQAVLAVPLASIEPSGTRKIGSRVTYGGEKYFIVGRAIVN